MNKLLRKARESMDIPEQGNLDNIDKQPAPVDPDPNKLAVDTPPADGDTPPADTPAADTPPANPDAPPATGDNPAPSPEGDAPNADAPAASGDAPPADGVPTNLPPGDTALPEVPGPGADQPITDDLDSELAQIDDEQAQSDLDGVVQAGVTLDKIQITLENLYQQVSSGEIDPATQDIIASTLNDVQTDIGIHDAPVAAVESMTTWRPATLAAIERLQADLGGARRLARESFFDKLKSLLGSVEADVRLAQKKMDQAIQKLQSQDAQIKIDTSKISNVFAYFAKGEEEVALLSSFSRAPAMTTLFCDAASGFISGEIKLDADYKTMVAPWDRYYDVMQTGQNGFAIDLYMGTGTRPLYAYFNRFDQEGPAFWYFTAKGAAKPRKVDDVVFEVSSRELAKMMGSMRRLSNDLDRAIGWLKRVEKASKDNITHLALTNRRQEMSFEVTVNRMAATALQLVKASISSMNRLADLAG